MKFSSDEKLKKHLLIAFLLLTYLGILAYLSRYLT